MTRKELSEVHYLNKEIQTLSRILRRYDDEHPTYSSPKLTGMPSAHNVTSQVENRTLVLAAFIEQVEKLRQKVVDKQTEIMRFITQIPDSYLRNIVELYCIEDLSWVQVSMRLKTTAGSVKMYYRRNIDKYLEEEEDATIRST